MASSKMFNAIATKIASEMSMYKNAVALMKELQKWGPDEQGKSFTFEVLQWPFNIGRNTLILASYGSPDQIARGEKISALLIGLNTDRADQFQVRRSWYSARGTLEDKVEEVISNSAMVYTCTAQNAGWPVVDFVQLCMKQHPRYQAALKAAANRAIRGTKRRPVV